MSFTDRLAVAAYILALLVVAWGSVRATLAANRLRPPSDQEVT